MDQAAAAGTAKRPAQFQVDRPLRLLMRRSLELGPSQSLMKYEEVESGCRNHDGQTERDQRLDQTGPGFR
jgi:hypothetical protein